MNRVAPLLVVLFLSCSGPVQNPCAGVVCGPGICVTESGQAACSCSPGFEPHGLTCVTPVVVAKVCDPNPCANTGRTVCSEVLGTAVCSCAAGQIDIGGACVTQTACTPNPCLGRTHQETCHPVNGAAVCICDPGYGPMGDACSSEPVFDCSAQHTTAEDDSFEPDECPSLAKGLDLGSEAQTHTLAQANDVDWVHLSLEKGHIIRVAITAESTLPLYVDVFGTDGVTAIAADHRGVASAEVRFVATVSGTHFVRVRGLRRSDVGSYSITAEDVGVDDYGNTTLGAIDLATGSVFSGAIQYAGDEDVVQLTLAGGHSYSVKLSTSSSVATKLEVINAGGAVIEATLVAPSPLSTLVFSAGPEPLFLRAKGKAPLDLGSYEATIDDLGADDFGDTIARATPIPSTGTVESGQFERLLDADVFSFQPVQSHIYSFTCNPGTSTYSCNLSLRNAAGTILAQDQNGSSGLVTYEAPSTETLYVIATGYTSTTGPYTYKLEDLGADDYPDTVATAAPIGVGTAVMGRLETVGDTDAFSFTAIANHLYQVQCTPGAGLGTCYASVTNPSGTAVSASFLASAAGTYKIVVSGSSAAVGAYTLTVNDEGGDDFGDTAATASPLTVGAVTTGNTQFAGDLDFFSFTAASAHIYSVGCTSSVYGLCGLTVRDAVGTSVATAYSSTAALTTFRAASSGRFTVQVSASSASYTGAYSLTVTDLGVDDHGDTAATATPITVGAAATPGVVQIAYDKDVFSFSATANSIYRFSCTSTASYQCVLNARDPLGTSVASSSYSTASTLAFRATTTGTYTVEVNGYSTYTGAYSVQVATSGADDHGDTPATATTITLGAAATTGEIQFASDKDVFAFTAVAGHIYKFSCTTTATSMCVLTANDPNLGYAASSSYGTSTQVSFLAAVSGRYTVTVAGYSSTSLGVYAYQALDLGADDHGNTASTATPITLGSAVAGNIELSGDIDMLSFTAVAGHAYQAVCTSSVYGMCQQSLINTAGTTVATAYSGYTTTASAKATVGGTWNVKLVGYSSYTGAYSITVTDLGLDDFGDTFAEAGTIATGTTVNGSVQFSGDVDWFAVTLAANTTYTASSTGISMYVAAYQSNGITAIGSSGYLSKSFTTTTAGTYYLRLSSYASLGTGAYTLIVQ